jgi:DNA-binding NarL/FixJ family response regulator
MSFEGVAAAAPAGDGAVPRPSPTARPTATRTRRRILVADDHRLFREGVAQLLRDAGDFEVVGQADDGGQAVTLAAALRPDVCLLDVSMPTVNGVEAAMRISQLAPEVRVVALSMHERADMADAMRAAGAVAYLSKDVPADVLLGVLRALG